MQLTRKQIIQYLEEHHYATASELSNNISVTQANIRHHLSLLRDQNIVEEFGKIIPKSRGRPTKMYRLTNSSLDNNLSILSSALINAFIEEQAEVEKPAHWVKIAKKFLGEFTITRPLIQRLNNAIQWLNNKNYKSRWEASPTGPRVILGFCPYWSIIESNPSICQLDHAIISQLIGIPVIQIHKLDRNPNGAHQCVFISNLGKTNL